MEKFIRKSVSIVKDAYGNLESIGEVLDFDKNQFELIKKQVNDIKLKEKSIKEKELKDIKDKVDKIDKKVDSFILKQNIICSFNILISEIVSGEQEETEKFEEFKTMILSFIKGDISKLKLDLLPTRFIELVNIFGTDIKEIGE